MVQKKLGQSNLSPTVIGLGCMSFHSLETGRPVIEKALELGINYFDTADLYDRGENERIVGAVLKSRRNDVLIATKVGNQLKKDGSGWDWNPRKTYIKTAVHESLRRLQTDYIDLYQLHGGTIDDPVEETIEAFEELRQEGHIRYYGISSIRPNTIRRWTALSGLVSVMTQYSLLDRRPEEFSLGHLAENQVGVMVRGALAGGLLAGKTPAGCLGHDPETVGRLARVLADLSPENTLPGQLALAWVLQHPAVTAVVLGASRPEQLEVVRGLERFLQMREDVYDSINRGASRFYYMENR